MDGEAAAVMRPRARGRTERAAARQTAERATAGRDRAEPAERGEEGANDEASFGYFPKDDAVQVAWALTRAGIPCDVRFDAEFASRHARATGIEPPLRRRSAFSAATSGYFVVVPAAQQGVAERIVAATQRVQAAVVGAPDATPDSGHTPAAPEFEGAPLWLVAIVLAVLALLFTRL